jgi:hypothetical protein
MVDSLYKPSNVAPELRPRFDQLQNEFAEEYEIWVRVEDFGRSISAGIVNRPKAIAVTVPLRRGSQAIRNMLDPSEIDRIRNHLTSDAMEDLML